MIAKVLMSVFVLTILFSCSVTEQETQDVKKIAVKMIEVKQQEMSMPIYTSGILSAEDELMLSFKTGGVIRKVYVKEGQQVREGQLLAQLDLAEISAYKSQARAALDKAERDLKRIENLYNENVATLEQKQNAQSAFEIAKADLQVAVFNETYSNVVAPSKGTVLKIFADAAELVGPGTPVLSFGSTTKAFVLKTGVTDKDVVLIDKGDPAEIKFDAYPGVIFPALVSELSATSIPGSGTYEVHLQLDKTSILLFSGFIGKVTIYPKKQRTVSLIPASALNEANNKTGFVYTVNEKNKAIKEEIKIAWILDDQIAFFNENNLSRIINEGNAYLFENSDIEIIE